jgi:hypothetical protein
MFECLALVAHACCMTFEVPHARRMADIGGRSLTTHPGNHPSIAPSSARAPRSNRLPRLRALTTRAPRHREVFISGTAAPGLQAAACWSASTHHCHDLPSGVGARGGPLARGFPVLLHHLPPELGLIVPHLRGLPVQWARVVGLAQQGLQ